MSQQPGKLWKKEAKPYKVDLQMLKRDALGDFCNVELCGINDGYSRGEICKTVRENMILNVVGKLNAGLNGGN